MITLEDHLFQGDGMYCRHIPDRVGGMGRMCSLAPSQHPQVVVNRSPSRMNPDVKALWLEALRSGRFTQAMGNLAIYDDGVLGHCCLGVLCEVAIEQGLNIARYDPADDADNVEGVAVAFDGDDTLLPHSVRLWAGLDSEDGSFVDQMAGENGQFITSLAEKNDNGAPFATIAEMIEEYF